MADNQDITLKIRVLDTKGNFRGGTVDVEYKHRTLSDRGKNRGLDASREINLAGLRRAPQGDYQITVIPTDVFKPQSQFITIPSSGFATMTVTIEGKGISDPEPTEPLNPGAVGPSIQIQPNEARTLITIAAQQSVLEAAGARVPSDPRQLPSSVLWQEGPAALLVDLAHIDVRVGSGLITVSIPVSCDQLPGERGVVDVDFVVGTADRPTGLLAAATDPRGPRVVIRRWGEALTALAWQSVLGSMGGVAAATGRDRDGASLIPVALTATPGALNLLTQARHEMDRLRPGRVVTPRTSVRM